jgi:uncharacterized protein YifN (PemK superfamily)
MGLPYHPKAGEVLYCNYDGIEPEMTKRRLAVVISPKFLNRPRLCTVVPISTTPPIHKEKYHYLLPQDPLPTSAPGTKAWVKCDMVATVCFDRLSGWWGEKRYGKRIYQTLLVSNEDLAEIRKGVLHALGLGALTPHL